MAKHRLKQQNAIETAKSKSKQLSMSQNGVIVSKNRKM